MNKLSEHFTQQAPVNDKPWSIVILCSTIVILVLAIFEPFEFRLNNVLQFLMLLGFAFLVFITSTLFFVLIPYIFKSYFISEKWTFTRMYIYFGLFFLFTGIMVFLYEYVLLGNHSADEYWTKSFFSILFIDMLAAFTIGLIPVTISVYMAKNKNLKRNLSEAVRLNEILSNRLMNTESANTITLGGSTKDSLSVNPDLILYIESAGNYVNVVYYNGETINKKLLRTTIKQVEETLQTQPAYIRCHRAYIVNINQIVNVSGNAQGYKLTLNHTDEAIPVSRTYMKALKNALK